MTINPRDYDLDELRELARKRGEAANGNGGMPDPTEMDFDFPDEEDPAAGSSYRAGLYRELLPFFGGTENIEKPYLTHLPETYAAEYVLFEWLEFLLLHAGFQGANSALDYYESVDWITEDVRATLSDYIVGIDDEVSNDDNELDVDDHMLSLVYVAKLRAMC
ncbi:MAG: FlaD/FlaE family flagellar protein [Haloarculaceae archaeon]